MFVDWGKTKTNKKKNSWKKEIHKCTILKTAKGDGKTSHLHASHFSPPISTSTTTGHFYLKHHHYYCLFVSLTHSLSLLLTHSDQMIRPFYVLFVFGFFLFGKRWKKNYVSERREMEKMLCMRTQESASGKKYRWRKGWFLFWRERGA